MPLKSCNGRTAIQLSNIQVGGLIRSARKKLGLTTTSLAKMTGMTRANVSHLEKGKHEFRPGTLNKMTTALLVRATSPAIAHREAPKPLAKELLDNIIKGEISCSDIDIGHKVSAIRKAIGLTSTDLAQLTGMSKGQISRLENGASSFRSRTLQRIAKALGVKASSLMSGSQKIAAASVMKAPAFYGPRTPQELIDALHLKTYRTFLVKCATIFMTDEVAFRKINLIAWKCKLRPCPKG